jgi:hypothetical protein
MSQDSSPQTHVAGWEKERDEWVAAVERLVSDVESWCQAEGWWVGRQSKTLREDRLGAYAVPVLRIQSAQGRLVLEPIARHAVGTLGQVDLCSFPAFDHVPLVRTEDGWRVWDAAKPGHGRAWSRKTFLKLAEQLLATS